MRTAAFAKPYEALIAALLALLFSSGLHAASKTTPWIYRAAVNTMYDQLLRTGTTYSSQAQRENQPGLIKAPALFTITFTDLALTTATLGTARLFFRCVSRCTVAVRFDDDEVWYYAAIPTGASQELELQDPTTLLERMARARWMTVSAETQLGPTVWVFPVHGFAMPEPEFFVKRRR